MDSKLNTLMQKMGTHSQAEYPNEAVGIITKDFDYVPCKNTSPYPKISFILDPVSVLEYEDNMWGVFHSHPGSENPLPSEEDMESTIFDCYKFIVGFGNKFFIYWYDQNLQVLRYEQLSEKHLC